jgi:hypothetical protein
VPPPDPYTRATITELEDWERNGAVWRPVEIRSGRAVVDLCSCTGELMERVQSDDPEFIEYVRARRDA